MIAEVRYQMILEILQRKGAVTAQELADSLRTSVSTVRRDLIALDRQGLLRKVHGGASIQTPRVGMDVTSAQGKEQACTEKKAIACLAAEMIGPEDFVFVDAGSTTLCMIHALGREALRAVYVTNGLTHARALAQKGCAVYLLGGLIRQGTEAVLGTVALTGLSQYHFTKAFLGVRGIHPEQGYSTGNPEERELKAAALRASEETWFLADRSKYGLVYPSVICELSAAGLIIDRLPDERCRSLTAVKVAEP